MTRLLKEALPSFLFGINFEKQAETRSAFLFHSVRMGKSTLRATPFHASFHKYGLTIRQVLPAPFLKKYTRKIEAGSALLPVRAEYFMCFRG